MKRLIITEQEKRNILSRYGLITERTISELPQDIQSAIQSLQSMGVNVSDSNIDKEFGQEGNYREDAGGVNKDALTQINKLVNDAKQEFPKLNKINKPIVSGYRSYSDQVNNFARKVKSGRSIDNVQRANTIPGFSQHHTGKAFDIFSTDTSWWNSNSDVKEWVANKCGDYGFEVTYKKQGTLRIAEPWHLYYIGGEKQNSNNDKINDKVDDYYKSSKVDPTFEKKTEKYFGKVGCKPGKQYTESPSLEEVESGGKVIRIGHMGDVVKKIQQMLVDIGYDLGKCGVDGLFGKRTKMAIESFQEKGGLTLSSSIDKNTLNKLNNPGEMKNTETKKSGDVILMGGLDYRKGDLSITQQVESLKSNLGGKNVIGFRYTELSNVINAIKENPDAYVVLFSAGAGFSSQVSKQMKDKTKLFIVEPYVTSPNTKKSVQDAVSNGVPAKNVIAAPNNTNRGGGAVAGSTNTPSDMNHWGALKYVGSLIS